MAPVCCRRRMQDAQRVLEPGWKFLQKGTKLARVTSINWRLIVTLDSSVVHLHITFGS